MKRNFATILLVAVFSAGCASSQTLSREMAGMIGTDVDDIVAAWGPAEAETRISGQKVLVWKDRVTGYYGVAQPIVVCERMLAVDGTGTVTGWRWRGDACDSVAADQRAIARVAGGMTRP